MTIESMNGWAGEYLAFLLIGAAVLLLLMFVLILVLFSKNKKLLKKYKWFDIIIKSNRKNLGV